MKPAIKKKLMKARRQARIRAVVKSELGRPRLCASRSNRNLYLQIIDDLQGQTLVSAHSREIKVNQGKKGAKSEETPEFLLGKLLAEKALAKKIKAVVFDRAGYKYHGRIKAAAEGARAGGLQF